MSEPTIYEQMLAAGVEIDHHESDLYARATPAARGILFDRKVPGVTFFNDDAGTLWFDIPFAYDPFWARKDGAK